ncbi:hypothetical protein SRHO_G00089700 [Serrasalmus rhombeus]
MFTVSRCGRYSPSPSAPPTCALRSAFPASAPWRARSCALIGRFEQHSLPNVPRDEEKLSRCADVCPRRASQLRRDLWSGCRPVYSRLGIPNYTFLRSQRRRLALNEEVKQS